MKASREKKLYPNNRGGRDTQIARCVQRITIMLAFFVDTLAWRDLMFGVLWSTAFSEGDCWLYGVRTAVYYCRPSRTSRAGHCGVPSATTRRAYIVMFGLVCVVALCSVCSR